MKFMTLEEFKNTFPIEYQKFMEENPDVGYLKVAVFTAYKAVPITNAEILISKEINNQNVLFFKGHTNESGMIENIELPAPIPVAATSNTPPQHTVYHLTAIHEEYESIKQYNISIFGKIKIIQYIKMTPQVELKGVQTNGNQ